MLRCYFLYRKNGPVSNDYDKYPKTRGKEWIDIHHIDENKKNNDISNLVALPGREHMSLHFRKRVEEGKIVFDEKRREQSRAIVNKIRPLATEWHKSDAGREWHKKQWKQTKDKLYVEKGQICENCGKEFSTKSNHARFCSRNCKVMARYRKGLGAHINKCVICGKDFVCMHKATQTCSMDCKKKLLSKVALAS